MKYFTVNELCASTTARARKIDNTPGPWEERNLVALIDFVLDPARTIHGKPVNVTSGYRCPKLNQVVGGAKNSQHQNGEAADITGQTPKDTLDLFNIIREHLPFDQLIFEKQSRDSKGNICPKWVHVSYRADGGNRHQVLKTVDGKKYMPM